MRFFIALEVPDNNHKQIEEVQGTLQQLIPDVRLTDLRKLHLTVAFIGEQQSEFKEKFIEVIRQAIVNIHPFEVTPAYIDAFPNLHHPRVFWIGVKGDIDRLFLIQERIKDGLGGLNFDVDDRRYVPHISIAKVNEAYLNSAVEEKLESIVMEQRFDPIMIDSIKLFESIPNEDFHTHNTLAEVILK